MYNESLINSEVCIRCGACCSVYINRQTNEIVTIEDVNEDCELVSCPHLKSELDKHVCSIYNDRPETCRSYHCIKRANERGHKITNESVIGSRIIKSITIVHGNKASLTQW